MLHHWFDPKLNTSFGFTAALSHLTVDVESGDAYEVIAKVLEETPSDKILAPPDFGGVKTNRRSLLKSPSPTLKTVEM